MGKIEHASILAWILIVYWPGYHAGILVGISC